MKVRRGVVRDDLTVQKIAATNPRIDARLFKEWREKMAVIERLNAMLDSCTLSQNHSPPPYFLSALFRGFPCVEKQVCER